MKKLAFALLSVVGFSLASGCSTSGGYEGMQYSKEQECYRKPESERQACLDRLPPDQATYEREREKALEGK